MTPIAVETYGSFGEKGKKLIDEIGNMMIEKSGEKRSKFHLYQRISMAVRRGNVASVLVTVGHQDNLAQLNILPRINLSFLLRFDLKMK